jgi:hypothetical protein
VEEESKISDKVLIQTIHGWALFNDSLRLSEYHFQHLAPILIEAGAIEALFND